MSYSDLLNGMMEKDTDAFLEMTDRYGWSLYSVIRKKYPDRAVADKIYNETMLLFYRSLQNGSCDDPIDALLCAFMDQVCVDLGIRESLTAANILDRSEEMPPKIQIQHTKQLTKEIAPVKKKSRHRFWHGLGIVLTIAVIAAVFWFIIGLLMYIGCIPFFDLGYSWVDANIIRLF